MLSRHFREDEFNPISKSRMTCTKILNKIAIRKMRIILQNHEIWLVIMFCIFEYLDSNFTYFILLFHFKSMKMLNYYHMLGYLKYFLGPQTENNQRSIRCEIIFR